MMEQQIIPEGYKQTEVGVIPKEWDVKQVQDVCGFIVPGRNKPKAFDGTIPWITTPDLKKKTVVYESRLSLKVSKKEAKSVGSQIVPTGSVIMSCVGDLGMVSIAGCDMVLNQQLHAFLPSKKTNSFYLAEAIRSQTEYIYSVATKTALPYVNKDNCNSIPIALPKIEEQTAIANTLSDVDALIASIEKLIAKKQAIKTATMQQLLTGKKRLPLFDTYQDGERKGQRKGTQQTEIGEIPEDWTVETITSISAVPMQNGLFYEPSRKGQGISLINVGDMYKSAPIDVEQLELFNANVSEIKTFRVSSGDLFFTRSSIVPSGIAFCNIYESENIERDVVFDSHLIRVRVNAKMAAAKYVYLACLSNLARKFLISSAKTATMTTIDQGAIKNCPVILPSLEEQKLIIQILSDIDFELEGIKKRLTKTQQIKQGMMQELLTGKTRLI
jgi:type I restriction enzyme S subunit